MPNHVYTSATIFGPAEALDAIVAIAENDEDKSILEHFLPLPAEALTESTFGDRTITVFAEGGYSTAVDLWGSKWADYEVELVDDDRTDTLPSITLRFQSAWNPVVEGYRKLSTLLGISAVLDYEDEGGCFLGASTVANGEVIFEEWYSGEEAEKKPLFTENVPAEPEDSSSDEWQEWYEAYNEAWNELRVACSDNAFAALPTGDKVTA